MYKCVGKIYDVWNSDDDDDDDNDATEPRK